MVIPRQKGAKNAMAAHVLRPDCVYNSPESQVYKTAKITTKVIKKKKIKQNGLWKFQILNYENIILWLKCNSKWNNTHKLT